MAAPPFAEIIRYAGILSSILPCGILVCIHALAGSRPPLRHVSASNPAAFHSEIPLPTLSELARTVLSLRLCAPEFLALFTRTRQSESFGVMCPADHACYALVEDVLVVLGFSHSVLNYDSFNLLLALRRHLAVFSA